MVVVGQKDVSNQCLGPAETLRRDCQLAAGSNGVHTALEQAAKN